MARFFVFFVFVSNIYPSGLFLARHYLKKKNPEFVRKSIEDFPRPFPNTV